MKSIIRLPAKEAREYFLKEESYFNFDLPNYYKFQSLLDKVSIKIGDKPISNFLVRYKVQGTKKTKQKQASSYEDVNYHILNNKDGKFAWRPLQLIHPVLYVSLVHSITKEENWNFIIERISEFRANPKIRCVSWPLKSDGTLSDKATMISNWWEKIEQKSIELALDYSYVINTDITDCYGSIYTHSIAWALHNRTVAKEKRDDKTLIGNIIDKHLQDMSNGQTNGIPQGSVLMDFIAELLLGYADLDLTICLEKLSIEDYKIIRYRDDYRIFTNNPQEAELILKSLTEILIGLNMKLNSQKTLISNNIIQDSIKSDKLYWNLSKRSTRNLQNHLLLILELAKKYPNSGSISKALNNYFDRISKLEETDQNINVLVSILTDIAFKNPRTYPIAAAILSDLLQFYEENEERDNILSKIQSRFNLIPNTGHLQVWLQRITITFNRIKDYSEPLCKKVNDNSLELWNSRWLISDLRDLVDNEIIIDEETINKLTTSIAKEEVQLFGSKTDYEYND
jgi:RNA-directed DNA polymerase